MTGLEQPLGTGSLERRYGSGAPPSDCSVCRGLFKTTYEGVMRKHIDARTLGLPEQRNCAGSGLPPAGHIHRCHCGAAWDEHVDSP